MWFSDESKMCPEKCGKHFVRKKNNESWNDKRFFKEEKAYHGGLEIMVWGIISVDGP